MLLSPSGSWCGVIPTCFYSPWALRQTHAWVQLHNLPAALADGLTGDAPRRGLMAVLLAVAHFQALLLLLHVLLIPKEVQCCV